MPKVVFSVSSVELVFFLSGGKAPDPYKPLSELVSPAARAFGSDTQPM